MFLRVGYRCGLLNRTWSAGDISLQAPEQQLRATFFGRSVIGPTIVARLFDLYLKFPDSPTLLLAFLAFILSTIILLCTKS